jgi:hypothetical protein
MSSYQELGAEHMDSAAAIARAAGDEIVIRLQSCSSMNDGDKRLRVRFGEKLVTGR